MKIKIRRKPYIMLMPFLIGVLSIFVYYSLTFREMHNTEDVGKSPVLDEFYYYGDSEKERPIRMP